MSHGHCHSCGEGNHSHSHDDPELGVQYMLYQKIDLQRVQCYNEAVEGSGQTVFKPWDERKDRSKAHSSPFISITIQMFTSFWTFRNWDWHKILSLSNGLFKMRNVPCTLILEPAGRLYVRNSFFAFIDSLGSTYWIIFWNIIYFSHVFSYLTIVFLDNSEK